MDANAILTTEGPEALRRSFDASASRRQPRPGPKLKLISAADLDAKVFPQIDYVVPGYIAEGLTILAGKPKCGKSWLCLDMAIAVACGGFAMGSVPVEAGDVLYLALEDNQRRLQKRIRQLVGDGEKPKRLALATECEAIDRGGLQAIASWCESVPRPRLIVVDVLGMIRPNRREKDQLYEGDYKAITPLKQLADQYSLAVIIVHHTSKRADATDPFDTISGTTGLTGAADTNAVLTNSPEGPKLYGRGRDIEEYEKSMRFDKTSGRWTVLGDAQDVARSDERKAILDLLDKAPEPLSPTAIAESLNKSPGTVRTTLHRMTAAGEVIKEARGRYRHPNRWQHAGPCNIGNDVTEGDE